jgi:hypothetical protein
LARYSPNTSIERQLLGNISSGFSLSPWPEGCFGTVSSSKAQDTSSGRALWDSRRERLDHLEKKLKTWEE